MLFSADSSRYGQLSRNGPRKIRYLVPAKFENGPLEHDVHRLDSNIPN